MMEGNAPIIIAPLCHASESMQFSAMHWLIQVLLW